jgi:hypothetical protein
MDARLDGHDMRFDGYDRRFDGFDAKLTEILSRLPSRPA